MSKVIYLTQEWLELLIAELDSLKNSKRVEIAEKLKEAIEFWDLSENSEYEEARNEQALVEKRILDIEDQLKNVEIITDFWANNRIKIWSQVTIERIWEESSINTYKIVWSTESDILSPEPRISNESPIGKALLWKKEWDKIKIKAPGGNFEFKIIEFK